MEGISYIAVSAEDIEEVREFVVKYFFGYEPMNRAYIGQKEPAQEDVDFTVKYMLDGLGLKAVDATGQVIGLSLGYIGEEDDAAAMREAARSATDRKWADIMNFLAFIQEKSDLRGKHQIGIVYEIQLVAVHPDYRGKSIGRRLVEGQIEIAKRRGFEAVYVDCSSVFTAKMMERLGFQCIQETKFAEYRTGEGLQIFQPEDDVHTVMKSFLKRI